MQGLLNLLIRNRREERVDEEVRNLNVRSTTRVLSNIVIKPKCVKTDMFTKLFKIRFQYQPVQVFIATKHRRGAHRVLYNSSAPPKLFRRIILYIGLYTFSLIYSTYTVELVFLKKHPVETELYFPPAIIL